MSLTKAIFDATGLPYDGRQFLYDEIRSRWLRLSGLLVLSVIAAVIEIAGVGLVFPFLLILVNPDYIDHIKPLAKLIDQVGMGRGLALSVSLLCLIAALMIGKNAYMIFFSWLQARWLARWKTETSGRLMRLYIFSDYSLYLVKKSSEIIRNLALTTAVYDHFMTGLISLIVNGVVLLALVAMLLVALPVEAAYGVAVILIISALVYRMMRRPFREIGREQNVLFERRQSILQQSIGMVKETKIAAKEYFFLEAYCAVERRNFSQQAHYNFLAVVPSLVTEGAVIAVVLGLVGYIVLVSPQPGAGIATLGLLVATLFRMAPLLNRMLSAMQMINLSANAVEILTTELAEREAATYIPTKEPAPLCFEHSFEIANLTFVYPIGTTPAISNASLKVRRNDTVGITGPSGSGKTTLAAVLMGLLPPTSGELRVDGIPLTTREQFRAWHKHLGYVPQKIYLTDDTIARNVAFAENKDEIDEKRVWDVLDVVELRDFVNNLPNKIYHCVGEDGIRLSGGQRQRLGIARALYSDPNVLLLDEATSALDVAIERAFSESLKRLKRTRTLVIVAHRLSTLRNCDLIVMLNEGQIVDAGPFDELNQRCEAFQRLVKLSQLRVR